MMMMLLLMMMMMVVIWQPLELAPISYKISYGVESLSIVYSHFRVTYTGGRAKFSVDCQCSVYYQYSLPLSLWFHGKIDISWLLLGTMYLVIVAYCCTLSSVVSLCVSLSHVRELCKNGWTNWDVIWDSDLGGLKELNGPKEPCIR